MVLSYGFYIWILILSDFVFGSSNDDAALGDHNDNRLPYDDNEVSSDVADANGSQNARDPIAPSATGDSQAVKPYGSHPGGSQISSGELSRYSGGSGCDQAAPSGSEDAQAVGSGGSGSDRGNVKGYDQAVPSGSEDAQAVGSGGSGRDQTAPSGSEDAQAVNSGGSVLSQGKKGIVYQWSNGIIPYIVDPDSYDEIIVDRIRAATKVIEKVSCVLFKQVNEHQLRNYKSSVLKFANPGKERECVHTVKRGRKGEAMLVLGYECMRQRDIIHALMHLLGFRDEVTHPHRDSYVRVLWENIQPKYRYLFTISQRPLPREMNEYDMMSIMHFHDRAYSINGAPTITPLIPGQLINPSDQLSLLDKMKLRLAFRHECNRRKVASLLQTCKKSIQGTSDNKALSGSSSGSDCGGPTDNETPYVSGTGSEGNTDNKKSSDGSANDIASGSEKGVAQYVSASDKKGSGSDTGKSGASSGSDKDRGGNSSGSDKDNRDPVSGSERDKRPSSSGSEKDKGGSSSGTEKDKGGSLSGSEKDKGGSLSGSEKDKGGSSSGSEKANGGSYLPVLGLKGLNKHKEIAAKRKWM